MSVRQQPSRLVSRAGGLALVAAMLAGGCASSSRPEPKPLESLTPSISVNPVWTQHVEAVQFPLAVAVGKATFTVAAGDGTVLMLEAESGKEIWRANAGAKLGAGVGSDGRFAAVVTRDGELVVLDQGAVKWRKPLATRVTTAPLVAGERVFVVAADRSVQAFDALDGRKLWALQRPGDPLTLSQSGVLAAFKDTLVVGQGPRMAGVDPLRGELRWEAVVGSPRGANEIERLADLVGPAARVGDVICARSFQAAVGCVNAERGALLWTKPVGGTDGVVGDDQFVLAADASDRITAWKTATGEVAWTSEKLLYHGLAAPLLFSKAVIFGSSDGTLHFLARDNGEALLRLPTDGTAIAAPPVVSGTTVLAVTKSGGLFAFRPE